MACVVTPEAGSGFLGPEVLFGRPGRASAVVVRQLVRQRAIVECRRVTECRGSQPSFRRGGAINLC
jgi:hypothetical protein